jgi:predicted GNAT superfamily acetyltransferase
MGDVSGEGNVNGEGRLIRHVTAADLARVLEMNNAAVPAVNALTASSLEDLVEWAHHFLVVEEEAKVVAVLITLLKGEAYASRNYAWFSDRFDSFGYVDRIAVDPDVHSSGIGRSLYDEYAGRCRAEGLQRMCAEVNTRPRNDQSLKFHDRYGFVPVGEKATDAGTRSVVMLELELA